jgi:hypothetical protein
MSETNLIVLTRSAAFLIGRAQGATERHEVAARPGDVEALLTANATLAKTLMQALMVAAYEPEQFQEWVHGEAPAGLGDGLPKPPSPSTRPVLTVVK